MAGRRRKAGADICCTGIQEIIPAPLNPPTSPAKENLMSPNAVEKRKIAPLATPTDLKGNAIQDISGALAALLADTFAIYMKTKNFHWHMSGPHFRDYHLLLDEHADQIFAMTDELAERARKIGGTTLRSIGHIGRLQRINDNDADYVTPEDMLAELRDDNKQLVSLLRETHEVCSEHNDVATTSLLENWIDEAERRTWFLFEMTRQPK
jgi:starvation-inducible DNA-binding protein